MIGSIYNHTPVSAFQPSKEVADFTGFVQKDYWEGDRILNKPWMELNNRSVIDDENRGQMMFNAYVDETVEDPHEQWKWKGTRSEARKKGIAMQANLVGSFLLPLFVAQNDKDEMDKDFSEFMRDIVEWMTNPTNSDYQISFVQVTFSMMTSPVVYLGAEWCEAYQMVKEKMAQGYEKKYILDKVLSGFQAPVWSSSEVLITNAHERNIQKQRAIIKRRWVEKSELEAKYHDHPNFAFVQEGQRSIYSPDNGLFYDIKDEDHPYLVSEEIYMSRSSDVEVPYVGGVYMGDDNVEWNPIKHRDEDNAPLYNVTPFGFSRIGSHFFYYKSLMNTVGWDNMLYDAMTEVVMNRAFLETEVPIAITGTDKIDSEVIFPNAVLSFENENARVTPLIPQGNMSAGFRSLQETKQSIEEGSVSSTLAGQLPEASQKAYSVAQAQANAKKLVGATARSLAESVMQYGLLMKNIVIHHLTVPEVEQIVGGGMKLKYRSFLLEKSSSAGKMTRKAIKFDQGLIGLELTQEQIDKKNLELLKRSGYPDKKDSLILINPVLFRKFKYLCKIDVEEMFAKNREYWQATLTNLMAIVTNNPFINLQAITKELMYAYFESRGEEMMNESPTPQLPAGAPIPQGQLGQAVEQREIAGASMNAIP